MGYSQSRQSTSSSSPAAGPPERASTPRGGGRGNAARQDDLALRRGGSGGGGQSLPFRTELEASFGQGLGHVRIATGPQAQQACEGIGANAFVQGSVIVCAETSPSLETLAHEVAHLLQQGGSAAAGGKVGDPQAGPEREAESAAKKVAAGKAAGPLSADSAGEVRREVAWYEELWWGVTHWDEVREGHRRLDELREEQEAENQLRAVADLVNGMAADMLTEASSAGDEIVGLQRLPGPLRAAASGITWADRVNAASDVLEVLGGLDDAESAWAAYREDFTSASARERVCDEMGTLLPALGRVLGHLPLPPGASHVVGLLEHCDGTFFRNMVRLIDANPDRWRRQGLCDDPATATEVMCGDDMARTPRGLGG